MTVIDIDTGETEDVIEVDVSPLSFPGSRYPTGWFQVAWSDEIAPGEVKTVHYFGQDIVLWRGESGELNASDAHCLHLGGHLGVGGTVSGECIVCPWHHWEWNGAGKNTNIPYSKLKSKPKLQLKIWPLREWNGCVLVWHDLESSQPTWEPPVIEGMADNVFFPLTPERRCVERIKAHPQMIVENGADPSHVMYVHGAGEMPEYMDIRTDGHIWMADVVAAYGAGKKTTWLTPDGRVDAKVGFILWGIGLGATIWPEEFMSALMLMCLTPVDDTYTDQFFCITAKRATPDVEEPPKGLMRFFEHQQAINAQDYFTWANMKILPHPNLTPEEAKPLTVLRHWAWQFYPHVQRPARVQRSIK